MEQSNEKVGIGAYLSLLFAIIFFSGIMASDFAKKTVFTTPQSQKIASVLDFNTLNGKFGTLLNSTTFSQDNKIVSKREIFTGDGGTGARQGFMFALTLIPTVMFALAMVAVCEYFGALDAMRQILTTVLRPMLGIPGEAGLALIASLQSTDAGAAMTRALFDEGRITEEEKEIFVMFQFSAGGVLSNFLSSGAALLALSSATGETIPVSIGACLAVIFVMKIFGANIFRIYMALLHKKA